MQARSAGGHGLQVFPTTIAGRLAVGFASAFLLLLAVFIVLLATGPQGASTLVFTPRLIPGLLAAASAIGALVSGGVAVVRQGERSLLCIGAIVLGTLVTLFLVGEFAIPPYD